MYVQVLSKRIYPLMKHHVIGLRVTEMLVITSTDPHAGTRRGGDAREEEKAEEREILVGRHDFERERKKMWLKYRERPARKEVERTVSLTTRGGDSTS